MNKITEQDLANRGVKGLPDVPGLTTEEMQRKLEEIAREILIPKVNELVEGLNNANSNFNCKIKILTGASLDVEAGNVTSAKVHDDVKQYGDIIALFFTPHSTDIKTYMWWYPYTETIYAYNDGYTGKMYYDILIVHK